VKLGNGWPTLPVLSRHEFHMRLRVQQGNGPRGVSFARRDQKLSE
jgi:hypothetical protein